MPVRIAVDIHPQHAEMSDLMRAAAQAEELGGDILFNWDHFYPLYGDEDGKHFECMTVVSAWAAVTETIEIGPLVLCNSYRNPDLLADMARTVDNISDGRFIFGLGAGWFQRDYDEYGYDFGTVPSRLKALDAAIPRMKARIAKLNPPPKRQMPILIGGGGEKVTLRITAEHADIWHGFGKPNEIAHKNEVLDDWCAKVGRDPSAIERSCGVNPEKLERADEWLQAGASLITLGLNGPDYDMGLIREWLAWRDEKNAA